MRALLIVLLLCLVAGPARGEDDVRTRVTQWLEDLRAEDFATREAARQGLTREGLKAVDLLEAAKDHEDPEVRRTVRAILARTPKRVTPEADAVPMGDFRAIGTITMDAEGRALQETLTAMGDAVGAQLVAPASLRATEVSFALKEVPFFRALHTVLEPHGLAAPRPFDALGALAVQEQPAGVARAPFGAAGPMRLTVTEVSASRTLGVEAPLKYALTLELAWTPHVQVSQVEAPALEVARDPDGKPYTASAAMRRRVTYGVSTSRRHHALTLGLVPSSKDCKPTLAALETRVTMGLRYDPLRVDFDGTGTLPRTKDGVTLHAIEAVEGSAGQYVVDFSAKLPDDVADRSLTAHVVETDGRLSTLGVYGGRSRAADGTVRIRARAWRGNRGAPPAVRIGWFRREERGTLRFRIEDIPLR